MADLRQSPNHARFLRSMGWIVERKKGINYFIKRIPLIGSFIKVQRPERINFEDIEELRKKYRVFQVVIEPKLCTVSVSRDDNTCSDSSFSVASKIVHDQLYTSGFKLSKSPFLPTKTIQIDLTKPEAILLKSFHYKTRYNIGKSQKLKVKIQKSNDIKKFISLWHKWHHKRLGFLSQARQIEAFYKAYGTDADLLMATKNGETIAGLLLFSYDRITYYMYAGSDKLGKKLFAPTLITWEAIKLAKKRGSKIFDFEGVYDERFPLKSWLGFTRFKKSFGGQEVSFPGCFLKPNIFRI